MPENGSEVPADIGRLSFGEKLKLLTEADKCYLKGYIDRALIARSKNGRRKQKGERAEKKTL
ncbi:hypothetical protein K7I13_07450 [Brucepastera parasyntrophica]|uniref:hypothetical protein n=1 Tax=Brucepastera parasyntrophica TaxID=2880008 RepID=UPI00210DCF28|nr:hypothetical protein [Brucepastera parasyntrophica]ULQ61079.1 hypothetical protein K7I13_07450 [Brucepastera parasyntrophica]